MIPTPHGRSQVERVFGSPELPNGDLNNAWAKKSLTTVTLPFTMRYAYDTDQLITKVTVHKLIAQE